MAGIKQIPKGHQFWPAHHDDLPAGEVRRLYEKGFAGAYDEPEERERFLASVEYPYGSEAAHANGWAGSGAGKLVIPFVHADRTFPGCWPGPAQGRGDCVSHSTKNAALLSLICEIVAGQPDEVTGKIEGVPEISKEGIAQGALSTEAIYWWRGHGGDGWSCDHSARVVCEQSGLWLRQSYPELDIDLTRYSARTAGLYGARTPPQTIRDVGRQHLVRTATVLRSFEEARDFLHNGYGITSCGSEGFSSTRDENGVSGRRGSWAHAMAYIGADDREETKKLYGEPLVLVLNSWGRWNDGPRWILGHSIEIPHGAFWTRWSDVRRRSMHALSSVNGWPARRLPHFGATGRV